jgi:hypothetical protein
MRPCEECDAAISSPGLLGADSAETEAEAVSPRSAREVRPLERSAFVTRHQLATRSEGRYSDV